MPDRATESGSVDVTPGDAAVAASAYDGRIEPEVSTGVGAPDRFQADGLGAHLPSPLRWYRQMRCCPAWPASRARRSRRSSGTDSRLITRTETLVDLPRRNANGDRVPLVRMRREEHVV
jgi:hypothetical protein